MKRPLAILGSFFMGGILVADILVLPLPVLFLVCFTLLAASFFWSKKRIYIVVVLLFFLGWTNLALHTQIISPSDLRNRPGEEIAEVRVRGTLEDTPTRHAYVHDDQITWRTLARVNVSELNSVGEWQPASGKILASTAGILSSNYFTGQPVEINGVIHPPRPAIAEGLFDYKTFLRRNEIYHQLDVPSEADWQLLAGGSKNFPSSKRFLDWAQQNLGMGSLPEDNSLRLLWAMTLGWKTALTDEVSEPFMRTGTMHIFAISGLHVALLSGILVTLLRVARVPRGWCGIIIVPLLWFYTAATGWQPSAIRSTIMMTIVIAGWALKRPSDLLNSLAAAALIVLIWDPQQLFQASFQLSFCVVFSLGVLMPKFEKVRQRLLKKDSLLPDELRPRWQQILDVPIRFVTVTFVTSLAAFIGSAPLVAYYFHLVTPISLLANMFIVPLSSLSLMASLGALLCSGWFSALSEIFNHSAWGFMRAMIWFSDLFAQVPGAYFYVRAPSILDCFLYYIIVFGALTGWLFAAKRRLFSSIVVGALTLVWFWNWNAERTTWRVTVLPLAGGESIFIDGPGKSEDLLIDCGTSGSVQFVTEPFLRAQGVNRLPRLLLTHGDLKNVGGATNVIANFKVPQVFVSPVKFRSPAYRQLLQSLDKSAGLKNQISLGQQLGRWEILHPADNDKVAQADDAPIILRGKIAGTRFLFLSDLGRPGQHLLWQRATNVQADIVIAGLPRESEPLNDALIEAIHPRLIVITDSEFPATERANARLRDRLEQHDVPVVYCRKSGSVSFKIRPNGALTFDAMNGNTAEFSTETLQSAKR